MKNTLLILALLWALGASGQIYINSFTFGAAPAANLLLDDYPNAAMAYSLRLLRNGYTGNCVEVRRALDNTTSNIGFSGGVLDTVTLKTFCSGTDCFVRTWYDQSTNGRNMTQTTNANQPIIIQSGATININNRPVIIFNASTQVLQTANVTLGANRTYIMTLFNQNNTNSSFKVYLGATAGGADNNVNGIIGPFVSSWVPTSYVGSGSANTRIGQTAVASPSYHLICAYVQGSVQHQIYRNGALNAQNTSLAISPRSVAEPYSILATFSTNDLRTSECIIYNSYEISNRTGIEGNINSFYSIY